MKIKRFHYISNTIPKVQKDWHTTTNHTYFKHRGFSAHKSHEFMEQGKKTENSGGDVGWFGFSSTASGNISAQAFWKTVSYRVGQILPCDLALLFPCIHLRTMKVYIHIKICAQSSQKLSTV